VLETEGDGGDVSWFQAGKRQEYGISDPNFFIAVVVILLSWPCNLVCLSWKVISTRYQDFSDH